MIFDRVKHRQRPSQRGQTMVEFALAFPIFLLIVFGIFEFGRLFITYTSVHAAAREGARYGAAVDNLYACGAGIESTAQRVGFLAGNVNVTYTYDNGPGTSTFACSAGGVNLGLGDRVLVTVSIPFKSVSGIIPDMTLQSTANRTIIKEVHLGWTQLPPNTTATAFPTRPPGTPEPPTSIPTTDPPPAETTTPPIGSTPTNTPTPTVANACVGNMQVLESPESSIVVVNLNNDLDVILQLDFIKVSWTANDRYLSKINYEGPNGGGLQLLWSGVGSSSPFYFTFNPKIPIYPGLTQFYFYFTKNNANVTDVEMNFQAESGERCDIITNP